LDARGVGRLAVELGAGRQKAEEDVDHGAGLYLEKKRGDAVRRGEVLARLYAASPARLAEAAPRFLDLVRLTPRPFRAPQPVLGVIR